MNQDAKELRMRALENIQAYSQELREMIEQQTVVSRSKFEERLEDAERKVRECGLRENIIKEYYKLVRDRDIQDLNDELAFRVIYSALEKEIQKVFNEMVASTNRLEYFYGCLEAVAGKTKTGFDYFDHKFKEEYQQNTRLWTESQSLCVDIKKLSREVNVARIQELGDEEESVPEA